MSFDPGPLAEVAYTAQDDRWTLVFVREMRHPPERVWAALTQPAELAGWAPFDADRDLASPGEATLTMVDGETRMDLPATVIRAQAPSLLEYRWGDDLLRWELAPSATGTRLTLRHTVGDGDFLAKAAAGWHLCLAVADLRLGGEDVGPIRGRDAMNHGWQELHDAYAAELGVQAKASGGRT
jgi:uncharacterized protein YndB with AHSA1/START domain